MSNHFLGFDLGHADTALSLCAGGEGALQTAPVGVEIQGQAIQPTALTRVTLNGHRKIMIGGRAIREASKTLEGRGTELRAAFKARPKDLAQAGRDISDFFATCLEEAAFDPVPPEGWAGTAIAVGCPASWSADDDMIAYRDLLYTGLAYKAMANAHVTVVPESRAALLQAVENPNSPLTTAARAENILIIDIGSSTLDFSLIAPEQKAAPLLDAGLDLGASFFDRQLLAAILAKEAHAISFLEHNPHYKDLWLFYARRTKEQYFIDAPSDPDEWVSGAPLQTYFASGEKRTLEIGVSERTFQTFRSASYDRSLRPSKNLGLDGQLVEGETWETIFEMSLRALKGTIERRGMSYGRVLLAGGASRMPFAFDTVCRVFNDQHNNKRVLRDPEPSHMVSRGLARWARKRESVEAFSTAARKLLRERLPEIIERKFDPLKEQMSMGLAHEIFDNAVAPVLERWRDGQFRTGKDVRDEIEIRYTEWMNAEASANFFVQHINDWWRADVKHELDRELDHLHATYNVSRDIQLSFEQAIDPRAFRFSVHDIALPIETIMQAALLGLAFAVTIAIDAGLGGIPFATGSLAAVAAIGGKPLRQWLATVDVPRFARRLPDRLPGRERLFANRVRGRVA
ncbi:MAG: hypothetical protein AAF788_04070, partial [Pseudomonadota bacterium]